MHVGAIGARTTPFRAVRIDEVALQRHGITEETIDLSDLIPRIRAVRSTTNAFKERDAQLRAGGDWTAVPEEARANLARLYVALEDIVREYDLQALSLRCWAELQKEIGISPCVVNGLLGDAGMPVACEVDTGSAIAMQLLSAASAQATAILDWNNNYGDDDERCILFHCGNAPPTLMTGEGAITDHDILKSSVGAGKGFGCRHGRLRAMPFTFGNLSTEDGRISFYVGEGEITEDPIPRAFLGVAGVARIRALEDVLQHIGSSGHRHHVVLTPGNFEAPMHEALSKYLGYQVDLPQRLAQTVNA